MDTVLWLGLAWLALALSLSLGCVNHVTPQDRTVSVFICL